MTRTALFYGIPLLILLEAGSGCSTSRYRFIPLAKQENCRSISDRAVYPVPAQSPTGQIQVMAIGIDDFKQNGRKVRGLHLRTVLSNRGSAIWVLNTKNLEVSFPNQESPESAIVLQDDKMITTLHVSPGELRSIDVFFELPASMQAIDEIPEFDYYWKLQVGENEVSQMTSFERIKIPPPIVSVSPYEAYPYTPGIGWGSMWWISPIRYSSRVSLRSLKAPSPLT